jgi:hypothetical protein
VRVTLAILLKITVSLLFNTAKFPFAALLFCTFLGNYYILVYYGIFMLSWCWRHQNTNAMRAWIFLLSIWSFLCPKCLG